MNTVSSHAVQTVAIHFYHSSSMECKDPQLFRNIPMFLLLALCTHHQLYLFRQLPTRMLSRSWGHITAKDLPRWLRRPLLGLYVWLFDCNMEEAAVRDLQDYSSLQALFTRELKEGARRISSNPLVGAKLERNFQAEKGTLSLCYFATGQSIGWEGALLRPSAEWECGTSKGCYLQTGDVPWG